ncbi:unnamed protein product, partial [Prorocentrum cordatum]
TAPGVGGGPSLGSKRAAECCQGERPSNALSPISDPQALPRHPPSAASPWGTTAGTTARSSCGSRSSRSAGRSTASPRASGCSGAAAGGRPAPPAGRASCWSGSSPTTGSPSSPGCRPGTRPSWPGGAPEVPRVLPQLTRLLAIPPWPSPLPLPGAPARQGEAHVRDHHRRRSPGGAAPEPTGAAHLRRHPSHALERLDHLSRTRSMMGLSRTSAEPLAPPLPP